MMIYIKTGLTTVSIINKYSNSGIFNFTTLSVPVSGFYKLEANVPNLNQIIISDFMVREPLYSIIMVSTDENPGINRGFKIKVYLFDKNGQTFYGPETITLNIPDTDNILLVPSNGIGSYSIFFTSPGRKTIKAYCMNKSSSIDITVKETSDIYPLLALIFIILFCTR